MKKMVINDWLIAACTIMVILLWLYAIQGYGELRTAIDKAQSGIERTDSLRLEVSVKHDIMLKDLDTIKNNTNGKYGK